MQKAEAGEEVPFFARLPLPEPTLWQRVKLPVQFETEESRSGYTLEARIPGLLTENIFLKLGDDNSSLTVSGLRLPTPAQAEQLRKELANELLRLGASSGVLSSKRQLAEAYAVLGRGKFGYFKELFRLPRDVSPAGIQADYRDGVLSVSLPKRASRTQAPMYSNRRGFDAHSGCGHFGSSLFF
nr:small heat shock protein sHsp20.3 [Dinophyceae sp.]